MLRDRESILKKIGKLPVDKKIAILIDCGGSLSNSKIVDKKINEEKAKQLLLLKEHKNLTVSVRFLVSIKEYDTIMEEFSKDKNRQV